MLNTQISKTMKYIQNLKISKTVMDIQWSFISLLTSSLAHFLIRIALSKELGPFGLGIYTLVFTIYMFGTQFASFGIEAALTKYIAEHKNNPLKIKEFISSGITGSILTGLIMGTILYLLSSFVSINLFHNPQMVDLLKITAVCFPFIAIQKAVSGILNGFRKMGIFAVLNIVYNVSIFVVSIVSVIILDMGVKGAVIGFALPTIIIAPISLYYIKEYLDSLSGSFHKVLKEVLVFGFYVALGNSIGMVNTQVDSLLIGYFMSETDVGYYATAVILMQGMILLPSAIQRVTAPAIATCYADKNYKEIRKLVKNIMVKTFMIELLSVIVLVVLGKYMITIIFSKDFLPAYAPTLILSIGYLMYGPWMSVGSIFSSVDRVKLSFKLNGLCAALNTVLNLALIPKFGLEGASIATSLALTVTFLINTYYIKKLVYKKTEDNTLHSAAITH